MQLGRLDWLGQVGMIGRDTPSKRTEKRKPEELSNTAVEKTLQAIEELDEGRSKTFDNIDELFEDLARD
jgi:hypothetical protein